MTVPRPVLVGALSIGLLVAPAVGGAQPVLEEFRFDPPQLCLRDVFQWGFSYRGIPGGLAAVKDLAMETVFAGRTVRSPLTPARADLQRHTADQGRFEGLHLHRTRRLPASESQSKHTLRSVPDDGTEGT